MAKISFKSKVETIHYTDGESYQRIKVPELKNCHCNMAEMRSHPKYGGFANSDLFPGVLRKIRSSVFCGRDYFKLSQIPEGVAVDTSGFLANVSFEV